MYALRFCVNFNMISHKWNEKRCENQICHRFWVFSVFLKQKSLMAKWENVFPLVVFRQLLLLTMAYKKNIKRFLLFQLWRSLLTHFFAFKGQKWLKMERKVKSNRICIKNCCFFWTFYHDGTPFHSNHLWKSFSLNGWLIRWRLWFEEES